MTRSLLVDFRSDFPIESHPQVRALLDQGWSVQHLVMKGTPSSLAFRRAPQVLVRLIRKPLSVSAS